MVGGVVVPFISVVAGGRPVLGSTHRAKADRCLMGRLCQVCGGPLGQPVVVLATTSQLALRYTSEPAMHPECARYSIMACPMVNGALTTYRAVDRHLGTACDTEGCGCAGWVDSNYGATSKAGQPAEPWHTVWLDDYDLTANPDGVLMGLSWQRIEPLRVRPVQPAPQEAGHA